jgi:hypothetical protein
LVVVEGKGIFYSYQIVWRKYSWVRSWSNPAKLTVKGGNFVSEGYDPRDLAYHISCEEPVKSGRLEMKIRANEDSPLVNRAFVINNRGDSEVELKVNGRTLESGKDFRFGHRDRLEGTDLIVWVRYESQKDTEFVILSAE